MDFVKRFFGSRHHIFVAFVKHDGRMHVAVTGVTDNQHRQVIFFTDGDEFFY